MKKVLIIDGHAIIHRAYHALPPLTAKDGTPTNAVHGFFSMMHKAIMDLKPDDVIVCFDTPTPTFRKKLYEGYQAKRPDMASDLSVQIPRIKELLDAAHITRLEQGGFEADDIIGTIAERLKGTMDILILTGDRDILQLVDNHVHVVMPKIGLSSITEYSTEAVIEKFSVKPEQIPDLKALAGDASDNYSAIKGLGPKTAVKLIDQFSTVEKLYEHIDQLKDEKLKAKLVEHKETVLLFKTIATIRRDVEIDIPERTVALVPFSEDLKAEFERYQFKSLYKKFFDAELPQETPQQKPAKQPTHDESQMDLF